MKKYKFLPHTADIKFQAFGKSLEEAFSNAALAMFSIMIDPKKVKSKIKKIINVNGNDNKALLYNFLESLLVLLDSESFLLNKIKKLTIKDKKLTAVVVGDKAGDYTTKGDVKAVTFSEMEIKEKPYMVQVVVDV